MKTVAKILLVVLITGLISCEKQKPLYDQVMEVHDEVMPKMDDLYKMKKSLQAQLADTITIKGEVRTQLEQKVQLLDSANTSMMVWMREFNPPDEKDQEAFQKYMEAELVKVNKMREVVMSALEEAGAKN